MQRIRAAVFVVIEFQIAFRVGWTYVSMVYSASAYGDGAASDIKGMLRTTAADYGICLAVVMRIPPDSGDSDYDFVVDKLAEDTNARVVLTFLSGYDQHDFFDAVRRRVGLGWFLWLGGDGLNNNEREEFAEVLEGSIYTDLPWAPVPGFQQYMSSLTYGHVSLSAGCLSYNREHL
jgi:Receptor family ligand binding region